MADARHEAPALSEWKQDIENRAAACKHAVSRGSSRRRDVAEGAWRCEGAWQVEDQMDIWQCIDEAVLDEMAHTYSNGGQH